MTRLRTVRLHGHLADKYGEEFQLAINSPADAVRALTCALPGFDNDLREGNYAIFRGSLEDGESLTLDQVELALGNKQEVHIVPEAALAGIGTILIIGLALIAATIVLTMVLIPTIKPPNPNDRPDEKNSFVFDGPVNVTEQGHPIPLIYGKMRVGSIVGSAGIDTSDLSANDFMNTIDGSAGGLSGRIISTPGIGSRNFWGNDLQKGGKGGSGKQRAAQEDPNSLQSNSTARILDVIGEGEIVGLVDGLKSVYFDDTQVQNADGSFNFKGVALDPRYGLPTQDYIEGFTGTETTNGTTNVLVSTTNGPVVATVTGATLSKARVTLRLDALSKQDTSNGDLLRTSVACKIEVQSNPGGVPSGYQEVVNHTFYGKTTSTYQKSFTFNLPPGGSPWNIRVTRLTADTNSATIQDKIYLDFITEITEVKLTYPDTALMALTVDAQQFGSNIPTRSYLVKGLVVEVPTNYDPVTRAYATSGAGTTGGIWDGTFKLAWTDNPAWCTRDLIVKKRYGLGRRITTSNVDKWVLYKISRYCDELINNGVGGTEPRFTCNVVINTRQQAYNLLNAMASISRSLLYWGSNQVTFSQDAPTTPSKLVNPSNTTEGEITYEGTDYLDLYSAVTVAWNDPNDSYKLAYEVVENPPLIRKIGWRAKDIVAYGCTSQGQARRAGLWFMEDQLYRAEGASYTVGMDHADAPPGAVIAAVDPEFTQRRLHGKVVARTSTSITMDAPFAFTAGKSYRMLVILPDGTVKNLAVTNPGTTSTATVTTAPTMVSLPIVGALWELQEAAAGYSAQAASNPTSTTVTTASSVTVTNANDTIYLPLTNGSWVERNVVSAPGIYGINATIAFAPALEAGTAVVTAGEQFEIRTGQLDPRQWRIINVVEEDDIKFKFRARLYDPNSYARVELGLKIDPTDYSDLPSGPIARPTGLDVLEFYKKTGTAVQLAASFSWQPSTDPRIVFFQAQVQRPGAQDFENLGESSQLFRDLLGTVAGAYTFRVRSIDGFNRKSPWNVLTRTITGENVAIPEVTGLSFEKDNTAVSTTLKWTKGPDVRPLTFRILHNTANNLATASEQTRTDQTRYPVDKAGFYWVQTCWLDKLSNSPPGLQITTADLPDAYTKLTQIGADGILTPVEKQFIIREYNDYTAQHAELISQGSALGVSTTAYQNAKNSLDSYLATLTSPTMWNSTTGDTTITRSTWNTNWGNFYVARQSLLNALDTKASTLSNWSGVSGRPSIMTRYWDMAYADLAAFDKDWQWGGNDTPYVVTAFDSGGKAIALGDNLGNDAISIYSAEWTSYEPDILYEVVWDIEFVAGSTLIYAGVEAVDAYGNNLGGYYNYVNWAGDVVTSLNGTRVVRKAYLKNFTTAGSAGPGSTPEAPVGLPDGTAADAADTSPTLYSRTVKFRPILLGNYANGANVSGKIIIHGCRVTKLPGTLGAQDVVAWQTQIKGAGKPSDNAGTTLNLNEGLAATYTFVGNTATRKAPTSGYFNAYSREFQMKTAIASGFLTTNSTFIGLSTTGSANSDYTIFPVSVHRSSDGNWYRYLGAVGTSLGAGYSATTYWAVTYDGVTARILANGVEVWSGAITIAGPIYLGVSAYDNSSVTSLQFSPFTDNNFASVGGPTRPSDNAGVTNNLIAYNSGTGVGSRVGNTLTKTGAAAAWDTAWATTETTKGNGLVSGKISGQDVLMALVKTGSIGAGVTGLGIYVGNANNIYAYEDGVLTASIGTQIPGTDVLSGQYDGINFTISKNGVPIYTYTPNVSYATATLVGQTFIYTVGASVTGFVFMPNTANNFAMIGGLTRPSDNAGTTLHFMETTSGMFKFTGNTVTKIAGEGAWHNAYGEEFSVGTAFVSCLMPLGAAMFGLGDTRAPNSDYGVLDYAFYKHPTDSTTYIYESGAYVQTAGVFAATAQYLITYDGIRVRYYVDGTLYRTVTAVPNIRYWPGVSMASINAKVTDLQFGPYTENVWGSLGGAGLPDSYATVGRNMVPNASAESGVTAPWVTFGVSGTCVFSVSSTAYRSGARSFLLNKNLTGSSFAISSAARPVVPGRTYTVRVWVQAGVASASGAYIYVLAKATQADNIINTNFENTAGNNYDIGHNSFAVPAVMTLKEANWTCPAGMYWASVAVYNDVGGPVDMYVDEVSMTEISDFSLDVGGEWRPELNATSGANLIFNGNAELGKTDGWEFASTDGGAAHTFTVDTSARSTGKWGFILAKPTLADAVQRTCKAIPVVPGKKYIIRVNLSGNSATGSGLYIRMFEKTSPPTDGIRVMSDRTSLFDLAANAAIPSVATTFQYVYTPPAGVVFVSIGIYNWVNGPLQMRFDDFTMMESAWGPNAPEDNATLGAAWGLNLTGRPLELTDGRIPNTIDGSSLLYGRIRDDAPVGTSGTETALNLRTRASRLSTSSGQALSNFIASDGRSYGKIAGSYSTRDDVAFTFPSALPAVPKITFLPGGIGPGAGKNIKVVAENLTVSGFTLRAKEQTVTPGTTYTDATVTAGGTGEPTSVIDRSNGSVPYDGKFTFRVSSTVGNIAPGEPGYVEVALYLRQAGAWVQVATVAFSATKTDNDVGVFATCDFGAGSEFGMSIVRAEGSGTTASLVHVRYTAGTVTETTLTPAGSSDIPFITMLQ